MVAMCGREFGIVYQNYICISMDPQISLLEFYHKDTLPKMEEMLCCTLFIPRLFVVTKD